MCQKKFLNPNKKKDQKVLQAGILILEIAARMKVGITLEIMTNDDLGPVNTVYLICENCCREI